LKTVVGFVVIDPIVMDEHLFGKSCWYRVVIFFLIHFLGLPFLNLSYGQDIQLQQELIIDSQLLLGWAAWKRD